MRLALAAAFFLAGFNAGAEPPGAAGDYRTCSPAASEQGRGVVAEACGTLSIPDFTGVQFESAEEVDAGRTLRDAFLRDVEIYSACVSDFIAAQQQPGRSAASDAPDKAACAHSWAEDEGTDVVRGFGRACIDFANRSVMDIRLTPYEGACYPQAEQPEG